MSPYPSYPMDVRPVGNPITVRGPFGSAVVQMVEVAHAGLRWACSLSGGPPHEQLKIFVGYGPAERRAKRFAKFGDVR